jgi:hypothetical protein
VRAVIGRRDRLEAGGELTPPASQDVVRPLLGVDLAAGQTRAELVDMAGLVGGEVHEVFLPGADGDGRGGLVALITGDARTGAKANER